MEEQVQEMEDRTYLRKERLVVFAYVFCFMLALSRVIRQRWAEMLRLTPVPHEHVLYAPEAYRVGMSLLVEWPGKIFPQFSFVTAVSISDFLFGTASLWLCYRIAVNGYPLRPKMRSRRAVVVALTLAAMHFPMSWTMDWLRPLTLPCAFYLVCSVWLLQRIAGGRWWIVPFLLLTVWQGFVRSDVAFIFGMAIALLAITGLLKDFGSRWMMLSLGTAVTLIAGGIQLYLQFIRFPHLSYPPGTPVWMWRINLGRSYILPFMVAMLPVLLVYIRAFYQRGRLRSADWLCFASPLLYLPLWALVGSLMEVRVFMPFYLMLVPVAARVVVGPLLEGPEGSQVLELS